MTNLQRVKQFSPNALAGAVSALAKHLGLVSPEDQSACAYYARWIAGGRYLSGRFVPRAQRLVARHFDVLVQIAAMNEPQSSRVVQIVDAPEGPEGPEGPDMPLAPAPAAMPDWYCLARSYAKERARRDRRAFSFLVLLWHSYCI